MKRTFIYLVLICLFCTNYARLIAENNLGSNSTEMKMSIFPNPILEKANLTLLSYELGNVEINAFSIDGKKVISYNKSLGIGKHTFQISLPKGMYIIQASGPTYTTSAKVISQTNYVQTIQLSYVGFKNIPQTDQISSSKPMKTTSTTVTDIDGYVYTTVTIGSQTWMVEDLKTTKYRDGSSIREITCENLSEEDPECDWATLQEGAFIYYNFDSSIALGSTDYQNNTGGYAPLYNWLAITNYKKIAPIGWHIPSKNEWNELITFLGGSNTAGGALKTTGVYGPIYNNITDSYDWIPYSQNHFWYEENTGATNSSGFYGLPEGWCEDNQYFNNVGENALWWSFDQENTNNAWGVKLYRSNTTATINSTPKYFGVAVRCIKDQTATITSSISNVTSYTATCGGNITFDGGADITERGICWNTATNPTISNNKITSGTGTGNFTATIPDVVHGYTYYVRAYAKNSAGISYGNQLQFRNIAIGDTYNGGVIFYINPTGLNGLVCNTNSSPSLNWGSNILNGIYTTTNASGTAIGTGQANTTAIINSQGSGNYAAKYCEDLVSNGYSDWYLPSIDELQTIQYNLDMYGLFSTGLYWSSTESSNNKAKCFNFDFANNARDCEKYTNNYVCPIRAFSRVTQY
jgi:uncharacterized protein (TIGR02145 family)